MLGSIPVPPDAFSALATTRSSRSRATRPGSAFLTMPTPGAPTMSPTKRIRIFHPKHIHRFHRLHRFEFAILQSVKSVDEFGLVCNLHGPRLADDGHLDLAGIIQLLLDGAGDVVAGFRGLAVGERMGVGD